MEVENKQLLEYSTSPATVEAIAGTPRVRALLDAERSAGRHRSFVGQRFLGQLTAGPR